jgi:glycosyltransferase involved in cell wall biosynthesis
MPWLGHLDEGHAGPAALPHGAHLDAADHALAPRFCPAAARAVVMAITASALALPALPVRDQPRVAVVTPVHNGEPYIGDCIESVLAQTYENWTYIIHENQSTDRTAQIADEYARRDPRIRVLRTDRLLSLVDNHNAALKAVGPEAAYVKVIQSGDLMFPDCLVRMVDVGERNPEAVLVTAYRMVGADVRAIGIPLEVEVMPGHETRRRALLGGPDLLGAPSNVLVRADVVRTRATFFSPDLFFHCADHEAFYWFLTHGDLGFVHQVLTYSGVHEGQATDYVQRVRAWIPSDLYLLATFGPDCLSAGELTRRARQMVWRYNDLLARQSAKLRPWRDREFANHHREALSRLAPALDRAGLRHAAHLMRAWRYLAFRRLA